jgi:NAD(P)H-dependent FMN reductase
MSNLEDAKEKLRIAILSGSTNNDPEEMSRSRALAEKYRDHLVSKGADVDWVDFRDLPDLPDWDDKFYDSYRDRINNADGLVISTPIYNYGPSGKVLQFLHGTLDNEDQQYKPYSLLSGAGSPRSALALSGLATSLNHEIKGIGIGGGVQVSGDDMDLKTGIINNKILTRAQQNADKLLQVANALRTKESAYREAYLHGAALAKATFKNV